METVICGDCIEVAKKFDKNSINLIFTSPPYAEQREKQYGGITPEDYPSWTVNWCEAYREKIFEFGSIAIVIRPNISEGQISDYILHTRLAMRAANWIEAEELIWIKPDSPPLGHIRRPRRAWESILWFSKNKNPFCDPKANGCQSSRIGFESTKGVGDYKSGTTKSKNGIARCRDYVEIGTGKVDKSVWNTHPAQFPSKLAEWAIRLLCPPTGIVVDPFVGSGSTLVACAKLNKCGYSLSYHGIDLKEEYCEIAHKRLLIA